MHEQNLTRHMSDHVLFMQGSTFDLGGRQMLSGHIRVQGLHDEYFLCLSHSTLIKSWRKTLNSQVDAVSRLALNLLTGKGDAKRAKSERGPYQELLMDSAGLSSSMIHLYCFKSSLIQP